MTRTPSANSIISIQRWWNNIKHQRAKETPNRENVTHYYVRCTRMIHRSLDHTVFTKIHWNRVYYTVKYEIAEICWLNQNSNKFNYTGGRLMWWPILLHSKYTFLCEKKNIMKTFKVHTRWYTNRPYFDRVIYHIDTFHTCRPTTLYTRW